MTKPEMIIFDYGHTLLYQPDYSATNGNKAIYTYIRKNPRNISFEEFDKTIIEFFSKCKAQRGPVLEIHEHNLLKLALEYMDITLSVPFEEAEKIIINGISKGAIMPYADTMLDFLYSNGIRTGVISNNCFSSKALKDLFDRLLPRNKFEFVLASSDYLFRKPDSIMFEIGLQKAGLAASEVWYCGDSIEADVYGAKNVGIFPVLYEGTITDDTNLLVGQNKGLTINFEYLHIYDWREMIDILKKLLATDLSDIQK